MKRLGAVIAIALGPLGFASGCVDGVTPDCADASSLCGPVVADARGDGTSAALPEAAAFESGAEASSDGALEAALDADLDAGDEG
jgi:hypothetical protein